LNNVYNNNNNKTNNVQDILYNGVLFDTRQASASVVHVNRVIKDITTIQTIWLLMNV